MCPLWVLAVRVSLSVYYVFFLLYFRCAVINSMQPTANPTASAVQPTGFSNPLTILPVMIKPTPTEIKLKPISLLNAQKSSFFTFLVVFQFNYAFFFSNKTNPFTRKTIPQPRIKMNHPIRKANASSRILRIIRLKREPTRSAPCTLFSTNHSCFKWQFGTH